MNRFEKYMMRLLKFKTLLLFCNTITLQYCEAQSVSLNDLKAIQAEISQKGLTRIRVQEDRIRNVFGLTGEYVLETDEEQGQIFIRPMGVGSSAPISLTLTTKKGHTQDLLLTPTDKTPEALILRADASSAQPKALESLPNRGEIEDLLMACQGMRIPVGYKLMPLDLKGLDLKGLGKTYRLTREIRNDHLRGLTYEVRNETPDPLTLSEEEFAQDQQTIAVLITKRTLNPGERTNVYVVAKTQP